MKYEIIIILYLMVSETNLLGCQPSLRTILSYIVVLFNDIDINQSEMNLSIEGDDTVCECIRMDTSELHLELSVLNAVFDPANEVLCKMFAIIELVAAAGRTIQTAAHLCGIPIQEVTSFTLLTTVYLVYYIYMFIFHTT
jgi:hypothetical protein